MRIIYQPPVTIDNLVQILVDITKEVNMGRNPSSMKFRALIQRLANFGNYEENLNELQRRIDNKGIDYTKYKGER